MGWIHDSGKLFRDDVKGAIPINIISAEPIFTNSERTVPNRR